MEKIFEFILTLGLKPFYDKNISYYKILVEFRNKLPRQQKQAKIMDENTVNQIPGFAKLAPLFVIYNLNPHEVSLSESEIDDFYNKINNFEYSGVLFKWHIREFTRNLNRFNPTAKNKNFDLVVIQELLSNKHINVFKPRNAFLYYLKFKQTLTSKVYMTYLDKKIKRQEER